SRSAILAKRSAPCAGLSGLARAIETYPTITAGRPAGGCAQVQSPRLSGAAWRLETAPVTVVGIPSPSTDVVSARPEAQWRRTGVTISQQTRVDNSMTEKVTLDKAWPDAAGRCRLSPADVR